MPVSVLSVARTLGRVSGWTLSNLELQKMTYMAEMIHLGRSGGDPLIWENFEAWANGPVVPELYRSIKSFGASPVSDIYSVKAIDPAEASYPVIVDAYAMMKDKNPGQMVAITHWRGGAWAKRYKPGMKGLIIPKQLILEEYQARTGIA